MSFTKAIMLPLSTAIFLMYEWVCIHKEETLFLAQQCFVNFEYKMKRAKKLLNIKKKPFFSTTTFCEF
jgi:hypothetical protein